MNSLGIINTTAPYGSSNGQEALDLAMASASFGQDVSLFFIGDGVFQLIKQQAPEAIEHKNYSKTFAALEFYDIENIYVCTESLTARQLSADDLCIAVRLLNKTEVQFRLGQQNSLVRF